MYTKKNRIDELGEIVLRRKDDEWLCKSVSSEDVAFNQYNLTTSAYLQMPVDMMQDIANIEELLEENNRLWQTYQKEDSYLKQILKVYRKL